MVWWICQSLLDVGLDLGQQRGNPLTGHAIPIKVAWGITPIGELSLRRVKNCIGFRRHRQHILRYLSALLTVSHQYHRRSEKRGIPYKAATVTNCAGRICQDFKVVKIARRHLYVMFCILLCVMTMHVFVDLVRWWRTRSRRHARVHRQASFG